jgi:hypothetical protein
MPGYSKSVKIPGKTSQELYDKISSEIERLMEKVSLGKFDVERDPAEKAVHLKSSMISATLTCSDGSIDLDAKLSLMAMPFKSKIDEGIDRWVKKTFQI